MKKDAKLRIEDLIVTHKQINLALDFNRLLMLTLLASFAYFIVQSGVWNIYLILINIFIMIVHSSLIYSKSEIEFIIYNFSESANLDYDYLNQYDEFDYDYYKEIMNSHEEIRLLGLAHKGDLALNSELEGVIPNGYFSYLPRNVIHNRRDFGLKNIIDEDFLFNFNLKKVHAELSSVILISLFYYSISNTQLANENLVLLIVSFLLVISIRSIYIAFVHKTNVKKENLIINVFSERV